MEKYIKPTIVWMTIDNEMPLAASPTIKPDPSWEDSSAKSNANADWGEEEGTEGEHWDRF